MSRSLFPILLTHEVCHSSKIYLLIDGLKLENGILKEVVLMKVMFLLANLPSHSLKCQYDQESNRDQFLYSLKSSLVFYTKVRQ